MKYGIRLVTMKGAFWWDGASMYERLDRQSFGSFRTWGWYEEPRRAQRYQTQGNALKTARSLYSELARLYPVRVEVVGLDVGVLGVRPAEDVVTVIGDCR